MKGVNLRSTDELFLDHTVKESFPFFYFILFYFYFILFNLYLARLVPLVPDQRSLFQRDLTKNGSNKPVQVTKTVKLKKCTLNNKNDE